MVRVALRGDDKMRHWTWIACLLQVALCGWFLWTSPETAAGLDISDSVEYSVAGHRCAMGQGLTVAINGEVYPTRYPPGLPLIHAAFHAMGATGDGVSILFIWLTAVGTILLMQRLGRIMVPGVAGVLTGLVGGGALMSLHFFASYSHHLMATAPSLFLVLILLNLLVKIWQEPRHLWFVCAGLVVALGMSMRITFAGFALPFAVLAMRDSGVRVLRLTLAGVLPVLMLLALCAHNARVYGGFLYTGYHYWLVPSNYELSLKHLAANLWAIWDPFSSASVASVGSVVLGIGVTLFIAVGLWIARKHPVPGRCGQPVLLFLLSGALPVSLFHLFYPFASSRFYLMTYVALGILGAAAWIPWLLARVDGRPALWVRGGLVLLAFGLCGLGHVRLLRGENIKVAFAREADRALPDNAVLITAFNAIHMEHLMNRNGRRLLLPLLPTTDYASMRLGKKGERRRGVFPRFPHSATEALDDLVALARSRRVFVELLMPQWIHREDALDTLATRFELKPFLKVWAIDSIAELKLR